MDNAEEIMHSLEEFSKLKPKDIPRELDDYLGYVAKTGDPVFKWSIIKCLFREKLLKVITDFYESTLTIELPPCPNVDPFNYERMKANLLEKLDSFHGAPFTVQRISELLTNPRKEYNRADKFMRAIEKNILVVSTREPGRYAEIDNENQGDPSYNGIPEPNDTVVETFTCNDLTDPDSSSQVYEVVNSESHESTFNISMDNNVASEIQISVEGDHIKDENSGSGTSSDDSQEENAVEDNTVLEKSENNEPDKKNESVICSTLIVQTNGDACKIEENSFDSHTTNCEVADNNECNSLVVPENYDSVEKEVCIDSSTEENVAAVSSVNDECSSVNDECNEGSSENQISVSEVNAPKIELSEKAENEDVTNSEQGSSTVTSGSDVLPLEVGKVSFVENNSVECDTSNSVSESNCDNETSSVENLVQENNEISKSVLPDDNEVSSCADNIEDKETNVPAEDSARESSVIHITSTAVYNEPMEIDECQVTVSQSEQK